jgi:hypothetical protein
VDEHAPQVGVAAFAELLAADSTTQPVNRVFPLTLTINQIRGFLLERGIVFSVRRARQGLAEDEFFGNLVFRQPGLQEFD